MQRAFPEDQCTSLHSPGGGVYVCVHVCVCVCCTSPPASLPQPSYSSQSMASLWLRRYGEGVGGPSNEYSGLISFRIDWFDLFAVQGTLKSLL